MNEIIEKINDTYKEVFYFERTVDLKEQIENLYYMALNLKSNVTCDECPVQYEEDEDEN